MPHASVLSSPITTAFILRASEDFPPQIFLMLRAFAYRLDALVALQPVNLKNAIFSLVERIISQANEAHSLPTLSSLAELYDVIANNFTRLFFSADDSSFIFTTLYEHIVVTPSIKDRSIESMTAHLKLLLLAMQSPSITISDTDFADLAGQFETIRDFYADPLAPFADACFEAFADNPDAFVDYIRFASDTIQALRNHTANGDDHARVFDERCLLTTVLALGLYVNPNNLSSLCARLTATLNAVAAAPLLSSLGAYTFTLSALLDAIERDAIAEIVTVEKTQAIIRRTDLVEGFFFGDEPLAGPILKTTRLLAELEQVVIDLTGKDPASPPELRAILLYLGQTCLVNNLGLTSADDSFFFVIKNIISLHEIMPSVNELQEHLSLSLIHI